MRAAEQRAEQVRGCDVVAPGVVRAGQRQGAAARLRAAQHGVVLRARLVRRTRHEAHDERRQGQVQAYAHRRTHQRAHHRRKSWTV